MWLLACASASTGLLPCSARLQQSSMLCVTSRLPSPTPQSRMNLLPQELESQISQHSISLDCMEVWWAVVGQWLQRGAAAAGLHCHNTPCMVHLSLPITRYVSPELAQVHAVSPAGRAPRLHLAGHPRAATYRGARGLVGAQCPPAALQVGRAGAEMLVAAAAAGVLPCRAQPAAGVANKGAGAACSIVGLAWHGWAADAVEGWQLAGGLTQWCFCPAFAVRRYSFDHMEEEALDIAARFGAPAIRRPSAAPRPSAAEAGPSRPAAEAPHGLPRIASPVTVLESAMCATPSAPGTSGSGSGSLSAIEAAVEAALLEEERMGRAAGTGAWRKGKPVPQAACPAAWAAELSSFDGANI